MNGPQGPSAYSGLGYAFTPGAAVWVADVADQSDTVGHSGRLQVQATDWAALGGGERQRQYRLRRRMPPMGLPGGLTINQTTGLISGADPHWPAPRGRLRRTATFTDANSALLARRSCRR